MRVLLLFLILVCVRGAFSFRQAWFEGDDICIAAGVGALLNDNCGDDYRYSVQPGYYRLVQGIVTLSGGDVAFVPEVMFGLSAIAGAWIAALALLAFPGKIGDRHRYVLAAVLFANPIIWVSSQYGNTAILATALGASCVVWLTRRPGKAGEIAALTLWGLAALVRTDAVLLAPVVAVLLFQRHGIKGMVVRGAAVGIAVGAVFAALIAFDPRMTNPLDEVGAHVLNEDVTSNFLPYLMWAMSPIPLVFALVGLIGRAVRLDGIIVALTAWIVPVLGFYLTSTTTPRYFLLATFPIAVLTVLGAVDAFVLLGRRKPVLVALTVALGLHLVVALGHRDESLGWQGYFGDASFPTDDGPMPTGWLIRHGLRNLKRRMEEPVFLGQNGFAREIDRELKLLAEGGGPRRIFFVLGGFPTVSFHYHAQKAGCVYVSREEGKTFATLTRLEVGDTTVFTVANWSGDLDRMTALPVGEGDQIWIANGAPHAAVVGMVPDDLGLRPEPDIASPLVVRYTLVRK